MCGICGQVRLDGGRVSPELLARMCSAQEHRGPDARGTHLDANAGLGIQRLRVIDLETGDQPVFNEDRSIAVVLNGEIYNFQALRERLIGTGHRFKTKGDTEVIAHLYEEEGPALVSSLHGMFCFALWDGRRRRLLLARDRVGKKPLFYSLRSGGALSFASELRALLEDEEIGRALDYRALDAYLALRCVPSPMSAFEHVRKLPPASVLTVEDGNVEISRYWRLDYGRKRRPSDLAEVGEELRELIRRAVRRRLVSDVPLGAFLSGGVDSSAVVTAMAEASADLHTFSIGFGADRYNELPKARLVADRLGAEHREFVVEPRAAEILPRIVRHYGEPFADPAAIASFYLAQMARRHVTVALNGDGGDEAFGGYTRYVACLALHRADRLPTGLRRAAAAAARAIPSGAELDHWRSRVRRVGGALEMTPLARHAAYHRAIDPGSLYTPEFRELAGPPAVPDAIAATWRDATAENVLDRMLEVDGETYLPNTHLVKMDIATMASSLEGRSPLLDHEILEYAAALPPTMKVRGREKKVALRAALRGWVPDQILDAPKQGFKLPVADWLRGELRGLARDVLLDRTALERGYFRRTELERILRVHESGGADLSGAIWSLLVLELWHREVVDAPTSRALGADATVTASLNPA